MNLSLQFYPVDSTSLTAASAARPAAGQQVTATVSVGNSGGTAAAFSLSGALVPSGTTTPVEGHLGQSGAPTSAVTGTAPASGSTSATLYSGPFAAPPSNAPTAFANYNAATGFDLILTLTDTTSGTATTYVVTSAVFAPVSSANLTIASVTMGVS